MLRLLLTASLLLCQLSALAAEPQPGPLVIIGGGAVPQEVFKRVLTLAGGPQAAIVVIPLASEAPAEAAANTLRHFQTAGAHQAEAFRCQADQVDQPLCLKQLAEAKGVFFSGGDQNRLAAAFKNTRAYDLLRRLHQQGRVLAGTSAGAAIMSQLMLTGNLIGQTPSREADPAVDPFKSIQRNQVETAEGFGFVRRYVIDQHFIRRQRQNRLLSVVLEHPELVGVGIDESTAIEVRPDQSFEVLGNGSVMIFDARQATAFSTDARQNLAVRQLQLHLLTAGQVFQP